MVTIKDYYNAVKFRIDGDRIKDNYGVVKYYIRNDKVTDYYGRTVFKRFITEYY